MISRQSSEGNLGMQQESREAGKGEHIVGRGGSTCPQFYPAFLNTVGKLKAAYDPIPIQEQENLSKDNSPNQYNNNMKAVNITIKSQRRELSRKPGINYSQGFQTTVCGSSIYFDQLGILMQLPHSSSSPPIFAHRAGPSMRSTEVASSGRKWAQRESPCIYPLASIAPLIL